MDSLHDKSQGNYRRMTVQGHRRPQPDDNWPYPQRPDKPNFKPYGIKKPKFERHVFISRDQIFYDLDAQISIVNGSRRKEDGTEDEKMASATTQYRQQFYRWIDNYIGKAKSVMSAFVLERFKTARLNSISQEEEVDITLLMPEWYDDTVFDQLCQAVHDYVVNGTLYEYFTLTLSLKDPVTASKMEMMNDALNDVRKYIQASKPGAVRKPFKPF
jgi:hypothetical protein